MDSDPVPMTPADAWWTSLHNYRAVATRLGRAPRTTSADVEEQRSGRWAANCRAREVGTMHARLSPDQIVALEASPFWYWTVTREQIWHSNYRALVEFVGLHHRMPVDDYVRRPTETQLAKWVFTARAVRRGQARGTLTRERIELLESIPGWTWHTPETGAPVHVDGKELAQLRQAAAKRAEQIRALAESAVNRVRSPAHRQTAKWVGHLARYATVADKLGRAVSHSDDPPLGGWAYRQRRAYRAGRPSMTQQRIAQLEATVGWQWVNPPRRRAHRDVNPKNHTHTQWVAYLAQYIALVEITGQLPNRREHSRLYWWTVRQKVAHRDTRPQMTPERAALLEAAPEWVWWADR